MDKSTENPEQPVLRLSVAIPTYRREAVLIDTLGDLLALQPVPVEILVLDQTKIHEAETALRLQELAARGAISWVRLQQPSITAAMNEGLRRATGDVVLFLDDDIRPEPELFEAHLAAHRDHPSGLVAGRVIQPWDEDSKDVGGQPFHFASTRAALINEFMGGNFSIKKDVARELGGFDENFVRVAYRFEAEFAHRYRASSRQIRFEPRACLHHLKAPAGGTRTFGEHLTTWRPDHAVGAYYFGLRTGRWREFVTRPVRAIATRYHLRHPWRMLATLVAELAGMLWAVVLFVKGPKRLGPARDPLSP
jgi:GT2 family glycosyltransferase